MLHLIRTIILLAFCFNAWANQPQDNLPITITSDKAQLNQKTRTAIHSGNVTLDQGSRHIIADNLIIKRNTSGKITNIQAIGKPAKYELLADNLKELVHGEANAIEYQPIDGNLNLSGDALLVHKNDKFKGPSIEYNVNQETVLARSKQDARTTIVLTPDSYE